MRHSESSLPVYAATASPRRRELLARLWPGQEINFCVPGYEEDITGSGNDPLAIVEILTAGKMEAFINQIKLPDEYLALAADTLVYRSREVFGKPGNEADAAAMLRALSGGEHKVVTGLCLQIKLDGRELRLYEKEITSVYFSVLSEEQIKWYISTGEPFDKAGAYGIQGHGSVLVRKIDGCYYNVMGLPVYRLVCLLQQAASQLNSSFRLNQLLPWT